MTYFAIISVTQIITLTYKTMRNIMNISLPKEMVVDIKREVKAGKFASTSEFMRHLIRVWNTKKLAEELKKERVQFRKGNYKVLKSLKDLR